MIRIIFISALSLLSFKTFSQDSSCNVMMDGIDKSYEGECKKGLANGQGTATGEKGTYTGNFKKGRPDGNGKMEYIDGSWYEGEWDDGQKDGKGVYTYSADSVLDGYWKKDIYIGKYEKPYEIISARGPARFTFRKINDFGQSIEIKFTRSGANNRNDVLTILMQNDSGSQRDNNLYTGFENVEFPFSGRVDATIYNKLRSSTNQVILQFKIYAKGTWQIRIEN